MNEKNNSNLSSLIIGIAVGAALTYLFTTKNGQKIKDLILEESEDLLEKLGKELEEPKEKLIEEKEKIQEKVEEAREAVQEKIEEELEPVQPEEQIAEATQETPQLRPVPKKSVRRFFFRRESAES